MLFMLPSVDKGMFALVNGRQDSRLWLVGYAATESMPPPLVTYRAATLKRIGLLDDLGGGFFVLFQRFPVREE